MIPETKPVPELPKVGSLRLVKPPKPAMPAIGSEFTMSSGRAAEAEQFAAAMGQAFAVTRGQNKRQKAKARARGRAAQAAAEKRKRR